MFSILSNKWILGAAGILVVLGYIVFLRYQVDSLHDKLAVSEVNAELATEAAETNAKTIQITKDWSDRLQALAKQDKQQAIELTTWQVNVQRTVENVGTENDISSCAPGLAAVFDSLRAASAVRAQGDNHDVGSPDAVP